MVDESGDVPMGIGVAVEQAPRARDAQRGAAPDTRVRRGLQAILYVSPVAGFVGAGFAHRWITDDGFVYLRVVQQLRAGNGPVFNAGERVEAFTGTLWVALLAVADLITPVRLEWLAVLLGLACGAAGLALAMAGARRLAQPHDGDPWFVPLGALVFIAITPVWVFATSGLETGLTFGWLGACLWVLASWARPPDKPVPLPSAAVLGLGWLVRPDLAIFSGVFLGVVLLGEWRQRTSRGCVALVGAALALPLAYQLFRMGYYGSLVPNTAVAKEGGSTNWTRGWRYLQDFADPYWLWVPAIALVAGGYVPLVRSLTRRRARAAVGAFAACGLLHAAYMVGAGGDYIHARLLLPGVFALCAPVAVVPATRRYFGALVVVPWAVAAVVALRPAQYGSEGWLANGFALPRFAGMVTIDDFGWGEDGQKRSWYEGPAVYFQPGIEEFARSDVEPRADMELPLGMFSGVGIVSYAMGPEFHVLDIFGLADTFTAHLDRETGEPWWFPPLAGHEKPLPAPWIAALVTREGSRPDAAQFPHRPSALLAPTTGREFQEQVAWARAALKCGAIVQLRNAAGAPLTPSRFAANVLRSFENTRLRVPADPEEAFHRFCGPGVPAEVQAVRSG
jgi:arabinofuranosyltransferase